MHLKTPVLCSIQFVGPTEDKVSTEDMDAEAYNNGT